jgi:hypothetical protein
MKKLQQRRRRENLRVTTDHNHKSSDAWEVSRAKLATWVGEDSANEVIKML